MRPITSSEDGFTLLELLVVVLIVGLLAAIALPVFLHQRDKAQDASAKADVREAVTQVQACLADAEAAEAVSRCSEDALRPVLGRAELSAVSADGYTVDARSGSGTTFTAMRDAQGALARSCAGSSPGCHAGTW